MMLAPSDQAVAFTLRRLAGGDWSLGDANRDGAVVLVFLETDCPTCRLALPYLKRLSEELGPEGNRVIAVSQDQEDETRALVGAYDVPFPVLLDPDLSVSRAYDPPSVPALFLVGAGGRITRASVGFEKAEINAVAKAMLT
jgi:peroxiredoxin Q/BCP